MQKRNKRQRMVQNQVRRLAGRLLQWQELSDRLARVRLVLFGLAMLLSGFTFLNWGAWPWAAVTAVAFIPFIILVISHRRVDTAVTRAQILLNLKQTHLARLDLDWENLPPPLSLPERFDHPFATDLDLLGPRSLHHLLDTAVSQTGSQRLRDWLLHTDPNPQMIARRQALVGELQGLTHFRDRLALQATLVTQSDRFSGQTMADWLEETSDPQAVRPLLIGLASLAFINISLFLLGMAGILPNVWLIPWIIYVGLYVTLGSRNTSSLFRDVLFLQDSLETLQGVFGFLESNRFKRTPHLQTLCTPFLDEGERPSQHIRRAKRVAAGVGVQQHPFVGFLLNAIVPWNLYFAYRMAQCLHNLADHLPRWLDIWYELEALNSLATFAWLNPSVAHFPEIVTEPVRFQARQIGHPLVPVSERVCNDYHVERAGSVAVITGSNMAGKSTFLRTLGINLVLAYAGAPVVAESLQTSLFRLFASIRVADSLTDGYSFFYAEVRRLEQLLTELHREDERPLFFLIDEIFRGTNNRERLIGSRSYIRALADGQGVGLIATHDLELVYLADESSQIRNFHFRDDVADGRMVFDYKLHSGPCPTTNALKIMRLAGLPVEDGH
ncbi:MAG: hypothetical protein GY796_33440 [Chloroflexi bacterium]|nr:hypothetical protein [Chloroflexota bacterium]